MWGLDCTIVRVRLVHVMATLAARCNAPRHSKRQTLLHINYYKFPFFKKILFIEFTFNI